MLRIGRMAGSATPSTSGKPGPTCGRSWALPIRSGVCFPYAPILRTSCCHAADWACGRVAFAASPDANSRAMPALVCIRRSAPSSPARLSFALLAVMLLRLRDARLSLPLLPLWDISPLIGGIGPPTQATHKAACAALCSPSLRSIRAAPHAFALLR